MRSWKHCYIMTSERGFWDETECAVFTNKDYKIGEWVLRSDGLRWLVVDEEVQG